MSKKDKNNKEFINTCFDDLFPILRSITGPGIEESIDYFSKFMPLKKEKVKTGTKVFDWDVPVEWHLKHAYLQGPNGEIICDTDTSNLHIVNYSEPIDDYFTLDNLQPHLHSLENLPDAIPYVTSYYKRTWGFCLPHKIREKLKEGKYRVKIESEFKSDGGVLFAHCVLEGESKREILLTSYLCHPSLANNELSGPLVLLQLYNRIKEWEDRHFTYRFLLNPETIGSLCFLSKYHKHLKDNLEAGLVLTCLGGPEKQLRYKASRTDQCLFNDVVYTLSKEDNRWKYDKFSPIEGSDERQYCSPGFNLPMGQIARSVYGKYDGYHNSLDDKEFMDIDQIIESADQIESLLHSAEQIESLLHLSELSGKPYNQFPYGEPQLGKRDLYPEHNSRNTQYFSNDTNKDNSWLINTILTILSMSDGENNVTKIAKELGIKLTEVIPVIKLLKEKGLIIFHPK